MAHGGGLPDRDSLETYGGALENYAPIEDATTDEDAHWRNLYAMNVAAMTHTAIRAYRAFTGHATTPGDPVADIHDSVWGDEIGVKPSVAHSATGVYDVTFPASVSDELNEDHTVDLRHAWANVNGSTPYHAQCEVTSSNVVRVRVFTMAGAADDAAGATITVFAI